MQHFNDDDSALLTLSLEFCLILYWTKSSTSESWFFLWDKGKWNNIVKNNEHM